jgi:hypothetical protein
VRQVLFRAVWQHRNFRLGIPIFPLKVLLVADWLTDALTGKPLYGY